MASLMALYLISEERTKQRIEKHRLHMVFLNHFIRRYMGKTIGFQFIEVNTLTSCVWLVRRVIKSQVKFECKF